MIAAFILCLQIFIVAAAGTDTLEEFQLRFPKDSHLEPPTGLKIKYLALGYGHQSYTCLKDPTGALAWTPHGAEAKLYDISKDSTIAAKLATDTMHGAKNRTPKPDLNQYTIMGQHTFTTTNRKLMPTFTIAHQTIVLSKAQSCPSPRHPDRNVDWLQLNKIQGDMAKRVYRTSTRGGKVSAPQCKTLNEVANMPYAAIYSFWA